MILVIEVIATSVSGKVEKGDKEGGGGAVGVGEGSRYDSCMKVMRKFPI